MTARTVLSVPGLPAPLSHYTDAVRFGDLLFISGAAPLDGDNNLVGPGDVTAQTRQVLENIAAVLRAAGAGFGDILKVTVYLTDMADRGAVNEVRKEYFGDAYPASTLVEVSKLAVDGMIVEIEAVAGIPG